VTVTLEPHLAAYAKRLVEAGKAPSVSAVVNDALTERVERDRRIARRWKELTAQADMAQVERMIAHVEAQAAQLPPMGAQRETAVYRVAQEALHNALRHSGAGEVCLSLTATRRRVILEVADHGRGFAAEAPSGGLGLASMRERASAAGGTLTVRSGPGEGTLVRLELPAGTERS